MFKPEFNFSASIVKVILMKVMYVQYKILKISTFQTLKLFYSYKICEWNRSESFLANVLSIIIKIAPTNLDRTHLIHHILLEDRVNYLAILCPLILGRFKNITETNTFFV